MLSDQIDIQTYKFIIMLYTYSVEGKRTTFPSLSTHEVQVYLTKC